MSTNPYEFLHLTPNPDGTLTRPQEFYPTVPPSLTSSLSLSKDVTINPGKQTWARLYLPNPPPTSDTKLPILVYVHGSGFIVTSPSHPVYQEFCSTAASQLTALVISVSYRLAPEHRLPAAYDDVLEALSWVKEMRDEWVRDYGDLSRCVLAGESAGGNIVYHVGLRAAVRLNDFHPLIIKGLVMIQPFFGGIQRSGSELQLIDDPVLPLFVTDFLWEQSLPVGADRGHEFCDPNVGSGLGYLDRIRDLGWRVGVVASAGDPLYDRDVEVAKLMEERGLNVKTLFTKDEKHGGFVGNKSKELLHLILEFLA